MEISKEQLVDISETTGYLSATLEKVLRLGEVLRKISTHPILKDQLVLKGGTALNMFYVRPVGQGEE